MKRQGGKPAKALGARDGSPTAGGTGRRALAVAAPLPAVPLGTVGLALGSLKKARTPGTPSGIMKGITQEAGAVPAKGIREGLVNKEVSQFLTISCPKKLSLQKALERK